MLTRLSDHQKDMIAQSYFDKEFNELDADQLEELSGECATELWRHFLEYESEPEECFSCYIALFDPSYQEKMDVFDKLWTILNQLAPTGLNLPLANIFVMTGRIAELNTLLEEFSHGLSKEK